MLYKRSVKCYYSRWLTAGKQQAIKELLSETHKVSSWTVDKHHLSIAHCGMQKKELLLAHNLHRCPDTWITERAKKNCFAEAYGLVLGTKRSADELKATYKKPKHSPNRIMLSSTNATINLNPNLVGFDLLVELRCFDSRKRAHTIAIPLKRNKAFNKWAEKGKLATSIILTDRYIQFSFEVKQDKKSTGSVVGIDPGAKNLLTTDTGEKHGTDIWRLLQKLRRKKRCSKAWYACREEILEYIDKSCKLIPFEILKYLVLEDNRRIKHKMKRRKSGKRLNKQTRSVLTGWAVGRINLRLEQLCEENGVSFRRVPAWGNSRTCPDCGHSEEANRASQDVFTCRECGHTRHADEVGAVNTLARFALGRYGFECKPEFTERHPAYYRLKLAG
jgi:transposase